MIKKLIKGTLLSIVIFFAVSFLTILVQMPPLVDHYYGIVKIGFPFKYFYQFPMDEIMHHGWHPNKLLLDCGITWAVVMAIYFIIPRRKETLNQ